MVPSAICDSTKSLLITGTRQRRRFQFVLVFLFGVVALFVVLYTLWFVFRDPKYVRVSAVVIGHSGTSWHYEDDGSFVLSGMNTEFMIDSPSGYKDYWVAVLVLKTTAAEALPIGTRCHFDIEKKYVKGLRPTRFEDHPLVAERNFRVLSIPHHPKSADDVSSIDILK
jgi:hypothetical protein